MLLRRKHSLRRISKYQSNLKPSRIRNYYGTLNLYVIESGDNPTYLINQYELELLQHGGLEVDIIGLVESNASIDPAYHSYEEICLLMDSLRNKYPDIAHIDTVGFSQQFHRPILGMKISDNANLNEDEPAVLFDGQHHASEPVSMECCLAVMTYLLDNFGSDTRVTRWINSLEIWIVPCWNPDGWKLMVDTSAVNFSQRRNLRDNNLNGIFDPSTDGVNLNRNYDFNWSGGPSSTSNGNYRGQAPFSELETQGKRDLTIAKHFVLSLTFHSAGETVYYLWTTQGRSAPDQQLIHSIADSLAIRFPKYNGGGHYSTSLADCDRGCSDCWTYAATGAIEFTIETSDISIPPGNKALQIAHDNIPGALYVLDRVFGSGIMGHVTDSITGNPISAVVKIREISDSLVSPRISEPLFGRYQRLLLPGLYTIEVTKPGYVTTIITNLLIASDSITIRNILLKPIQSGVENYSTSVPSQFLLFDNYPNPFNPSTKISYTIPERGNVSIKIFNLLGSEIDELVKGEIEAGEHSIEFNSRNLPSGVYFYRMQVYPAKGGTGIFIDTKKMLLLK
jgi:hypothetical protein